MNESGFLLICSGVPVPIIVPPLSPPSGPISMILSAVLIKSKLCSITIIVLPVSTSLCKISTSLWTSSIWRPVVGSSNIYNVLPVALFDSSVASLILWASPPDNVVDGWPSLIYPKPTSWRVWIFCLILGMWLKIHWLLQLSY